MGIYNCAPTLQDALDSLYAQTYQDFEIILCNDGSKDNTYELALENQKKHPNIVLLNNPHNMGLNQTLNNCLAVAKGEYIARMDGDDLCDPTRFEKEIKFLDDHSEFAIVSTAMEHFDENGVFRISRKPEYPTKKDFPIATPFCHAPCMVRTEAMKAVGGYSVAKGLLRVEDYHLWIKLYAKGYKGYNMQEPLYQMRDDRNAVARRNWMSRKNAFRVRNLAVSMLGNPFWMRIYSLKSIILYFMPTGLYTFLHKRN